MSKNSRSHLPDSPAASGKFSIRLRLILGAGAFCGAILHAQENAPPPRQAPQENVQFVTVDENVKVEVIDWGGTGRPVILLAGLGGHARGFAKFAPKLVPTYHVFSITRRGFAPSSIPASGYSADRLGDDVIAVIDALKLVRPVLAGFSMAGEELSSVGTRHPEKISGLVYLDAGYSFALYDRVHGDLQLDTLDAIKDLQLMQPGKGPPDLGPVIDRLLEDLPRIEKQLQAKKSDLKLVSDLQSQSQPGQPKAAQPQPAVPPVMQAIFAGEQKYPEIRVPVLAIFAFPHAPPPAFKNNPALQAKVEAWDLATNKDQVDAFERQVPSARVVRLAHAAHAVHESNEADVLREMNAFIASLP